MWDQPYLETCCRSALHRLCLCEAAHTDGRPDGLKDGPCLRRLTDMGLACPDPGSRYHVTEAGRRRHRTEILRQPATGA